MNGLKIATLSLDIVWADRDENLYALRQALKSVPRDTDIVVLPELFNTGFISTSDILHRMAENVDDSETIGELFRLARKYNFALTGSMLVRQGDDIFNRGFFIEPSGDSMFYDKKHLFSLSTESRDFTAGKEIIPIARFRGWNVALAICYDIRFPVWLRNVENRYDVMLVPANWPEKRAYAWKHLLIGRAIENQAYIVGCNRSGRDDYGEYENLTFAFDYAGKPILKPLSADYPRIGIAELQKDKLSDFRNSFPASDDADSFRLVTP